MKKLQTAYHEAGHHAVAFVTGLAPGDVSIVPGAKPGEWKGASHVDVGADKFAALVMLKAGAIAEELMEGCDPSDSGVRGGEDDKMVLKRAIELGCREAECDTLGRMADAFARQLLQREDVQSAVKALAEALNQKEHLSADEAKGILSVISCDYGLDCEILSPEAFEKLKKKPLQG